MDKKIVVVSLILVVLACAVGISIKLNLDSNESTDIVSCASISEEEYEISSYITDEIKSNTQTGEFDLLLVEDYTPQSLGEDADCIALATVISLDSADPDGSIIGMTYGQLVINEVLYGDDISGQVITYSKPGGVMLMSEWEETQDEEATAKREYLRQINGIELDLDNTYIEILADGDIEIEAGKSYLVYLKGSDLNYEIIGLGTGLRELNVEQATNYVTAQDMSNTSDFQILNNETGEYESLGEYIQNYIDNI